MQPVFKGANYPRRPDMAIVRRIGWVLLGVVIGVIASSTLTAARLPQDRPVPRLITPWNALPVDGGAGHFIKDTKTGARWLTVRFREQ
jgi:hypothetical protein